MNISAIRFSNPFVKNDCNTKTTRKNSQKAPVSDSFVPSFKGEISKKKLKKELSETLNVFGDKKFNRFGVEQVASRIKTKLQKQLLDQLLEKRNLIDTDRYHRHGIAQIFESAKTDEQILFAMKLADMSSEFSPAKFMSIDIAELAENAESKEQEDLILELCDVKDLLIGYDFFDIEDLILIARSTENKEAAIVKSKLLPILFDMRNSFDNQLFPAYAITKMLRGINTEEESETALYIIEKFFEIKNKLGFAYFGADSLIELAVNTKTIEEADVKIALAKKIYEIKAPEEDYIPEFSHMKIGKMVGNAHTEEQAKVKYELMLKLREMTTDGYERFIDSEVCKFVAKVQTEEQSQALLEDIKRRYHDDD